MTEPILVLPNKWVWWKVGECVVEVLKRGHYPTTAMCKLPNDKVTEIELVELDIHRSSYEQC